MAFGSDRKVMTQEQVRRAEIDVGLRQYMLRVYNYMCAALAMTGLVAYIVSTNETMMAYIFGTPLMWVAIFAPLALVFFISFRINHMSAATAQMTFWIYACLVGLSLSILFLAYSGTSIARVFFITASAFAGLSIIGYTTKKNLSGMGSFLFMGLIGLIVAMVVNIFLGSSTLEMLISFAGVLIFAGLTAYDTQQIKLMYYEGDGGEVATKKAVMGALKLYLDFLNMFLFLLHIFGGRE
jgi:FtsH-binding integral membrane protein